MSQDPKSQLSSSGIDFTKTIRSDTYDFIKPEQFDLNGKAVLITGASKGVGRKAAASYAKAGTSFIAVGARSSLVEVEKEILDAASRAGRPAPKVLSLKLNVADEASVENAAKEVEAAFGRLDILCNNAGYLETFTKIGKSKVDEWWGKTMESNLKGVYLCSRAFLPLLLKGELKTVLNTSSIGANIISPGASGYQLTKLAVVRFSEFLNEDHGDQGLLSFSIHPGAVMTELASALPEETLKILNDKPELAGDSMVWLTAVRREWLAGRYVSVTWDMEEFLGRKQNIVEGDLLKIRLDVGVDRG